MRTWQAYSIVNVEARADQVGQTVNEVGKPPGIVMLYGSRVSLLHLYPIRVEVLLIQVNHAGPVVA